MVGMHIYIFPSCLENSTGCACFLFTVIDQMFCDRCAAAVPNYNPLRDPSFGPIPGEDPSYSDYFGVAPPFPGNLSSPILNTTSGTPGLDDVVFQNLLSAEWLVYNVYQQGVELFNASDFINAGFPNTTFDRIAQIRDSEAGHARVFQDQISNASVVPGPCK